MRRMLAACAALAALGPGPAAAANHLYSSGPLSIPIREGRTAESAIAVRDAGPVLRLSVLVRLDDARQSGLTLTLVAPDGTSAVLVRGSRRDLGAGPGCNGELAVFSDAYGDFKPQQALRIFDGRPARGRWLLRVALGAPGAEGHLACWKLDLSRDVVETVRARSGAVSAAVSFREQRTGFRYGKVRLEIRRDGRPALGAPLAGEYGGVGPLAVRDLDADGDPEIQLDLFTGGAHCCFESIIYRWVPVRSRYERMLAWWGDLGYRLADLDRDGRPELVTGDDGFAYVFTDYASSAFPLAVWRFDRGRLIDVTREYPAEVEKDARGLYRGYLEERRRPGGEARGVLAAYLADEYRLGRGAEGWAVLQAAYRRGDVGRTKDRLGTPAGRAYLETLRRFLVEGGYVPVNGRIAFQRGEAIWVARADGSGARRISAGHRPAWSPDGKHLAFELDGAIRVGTGRVAPGADPSWSVDGLHLAFDRRGSLFEIGIDGRGERRLGTGTGPAWAPLGRRLAFERGGWIWVGTHRLARGEAPSWSPDARAIAFSRDGELWTVRSAGGGERRLTSGSDPAWSPDGTLIVFERGAGLFVVGPDGKGLRRLTVGGAPDWAPLRRK